MPVSLNLMRAAESASHRVVTQHIRPHNTLSDVPANVLNLHNYLKIKAIFVVAFQFNICEDSSCMRDVRLCFVVCCEEPGVAVVPPGPEVSFAPLSVYDRGGEGSN